MKNYIELALRTESFNWNEPNHRLLHAAMGLVTETAELMTSTSRENYAEELGDVLWYVAIACDVLEISFDEAEEAAGNFEPCPHLGAEDLVIAAADIMDMLKKSVFYGKVICLGRVAERLGQIICLVSELGGDLQLDEIMAANIYKLEQRYPQLKFSQMNALNR